MFAFPAASAYDGGKTVRALDIPPSCAGIAMPERHDDRQAALAQAFRLALRSCRELYDNCTAEQLKRHAGQVTDEPDAFKERIRELYRGLMLKVFADMALADQTISAEETELAQVLFEELWGKPLSLDQTREALHHYAEKESLRWDSLLWPFERLRAFQERKAELQALVMGLAHHVAQAKGRVAATESRQLQWIMKQLQRILDPLPYATEAPTAKAEEGGKRGKYATQGEQARQRSGNVRHQARTDPAKLREVLAELDALIGLGNIKYEVHEMVNYLKMQEERRRHDLPLTPISLHAIFSGNPGTGKTTVARLLGRIFGAMGILSKGHLVETDRSGLVAEYSGQTGPKTNERIDEALDGVLFVDEAYSLVADAGEDPFGEEAVQTLLKRMEDDRDRLVVILAGYPRPMRRLLRSNPGLASRIGRTFEFPDYAAQEMGQIFGQFAAENHYELPARTRAKLLLGFEYLRQEKDEKFGNGRLVRNVFERSIRRLANRLAGKPKLTRELLTMLQPEDVVMEGVPEKTWDVLEKDTQLFRLGCPSCQAVSKLPQKLLGSRVQCRKCQHEFQADWGEVLGEAS
jgi:hypothetical protein